MRRPLRFAVFGDGAWAAGSLRRLERDGHLPVAVVVRRRPSGTDLADAARAMEVPVLAPERVNDPAFADEIGRLAPDIGVSIAYDQIFRAPLFSLPRHGILNFHAGKLPHYRGRNIINWALLNGETEIGVTAHVVDDGVDTGDIVLQKTLAVGWTDTYGDVLARVVAMMPDVVSEAVGLVADGRAERRPQPRLAGTYFAGRERGDEWLDWHDASVRLHNKVRAISRPGPGARTLMGDATVVVWTALFDPSWPTYLATPGQVVCRIAGSGVLVKTGDSHLLVSEVQLEGGPVVTPDWPIGTRLGRDPLVEIPNLLARLRVLERRLTDPKP